MSDYQYIPNTTEIQAYDFCYTPGQEDPLYVLGPHPILAWALLTPMLSSDDPEQHTVALAICAECKMPNAERLLQYPREYVIVETESIFVEGKVVYQNDTTYTNLEHAKAEFRKRYETRRRLEGLQK